MELLFYHHSIILRASNRTPDECFCYGPQNCQKNIATIPHVPKLSSTFLLNHQPNPKSHHYQIQKYAPPPNNGHVMCPKLGSYLNMLTQLNPSGQRYERPECRQNYKNFHHNPNYQKMVSKVRIEPTTPSMLWTPNSECLLSCLSYLLRGNYSRDLILPTLLSALSTWENIKGNYSD